MLASTAVVSTGIWKLSTLYFNELWGWNWIAMFGYFLTGTIKSATHSSRSKMTVFFNSLFSCVFLSVAAISLQLFVFYWALLPDSTSSVVTNPIRFVGFNGGLFLMLLETVTARIEVDIKQMMICSPVTLLFILWTWFSNYVLKWDFPIDEIRKHLSYILAAYPLILNLLLAVMINIAAAFVVFFLVGFRDLVGHRFSGHATKNSVPV